MARQTNQPDRHGVLQMSEEDCWAQLRNHDLGHVAVVVDGRPCSFPVNYAVGERSIVFRSDPGAKLEHGPGSDSSFEIDGYDPSSLHGWSVMAFGRLEDITEPRDERSRTLRGLAVHPLAPGAKLHWIALHVDRLTGLHFTSGWVVPGEFFG